MAVTLMSRVMARFGQWLGQYVPTNSRSAVWPMAAEVNPRLYFEMLQRYYLNNALYDTMAGTLNNRWLDGKRFDNIKAIRNPANRVVEFYAAKLFPGSLDQGLPLLAENARIVDPIKLIWKWSNWTENKQVYARHAAMYGSTFLKVAQLEDGRPYLQNIGAHRVSDLKENERGFVTRIRIDTAVYERVAGKDEVRTLTEYWDEANGYREWLHEKGDTDVEQLGAPRVTRSLADFGIDFVPVVHARFRPIGELYGAGAFVHALDKIDEVNASASRLNRMVYRNKAVWALAGGGSDVAGRPLPAPRVQDKTGADINISELEEDGMISLPGQATLQSLVPPLNFEGLLSIVSSQMEELKDDLPELHYYTRDQVNAEESGRALRYKLAGALDRASEARGNLEQAMIRAHQMALTMGQAAAVDGFSGIGDFDAGDFEHSFRERDILPADETERAAANTQFWNAAKAAEGVGVPLAEYLKDSGWDDARIARIIDSENYKARRAMATMALNNQQQQFQQ